MTIQAETHSALDNPAPGTPIISDSDDEEVVQCQSGDSGIQKEVEREHESRGSEIDTLKTDDSFLSDSDAASQVEVLPSDENVEEIKGDDEEWPEAFY